MTEEELRKDDLAWTGYLLAKQIERNARLVAAIQRIEAINDNPATFNKDIDDVCAAALQRSSGDQQSPG